MDDNLLNLILNIFAKNPYAVSQYADSTASANALKQVQSGQLSAEDFLAKTAQNGWKLSPETESYISSMLSNQRTNEARDYETSMANTDLLRAASQLQQLGLSPNNVLQTGGSATPNVAAASSPVLNNANQRYDRMSSLANSLIGMAGRMASSGIYGSALKAVRETAAKTAAMTMNSARVIRNFDRNGDLINESEETFVRSRKPSDLLKI